jgi:hypothetical protein
MEDILAISLIFGGGTLFLLAISPIGRAIAERIRQRGQVLPDDLRSELETFREEVRGDLEALRGEVGELAERVDFSERVLAKQREAERLPPVR